MCECVLCADRGVSLRKQIPWELSQSGHGETFNPQRQLGVEEDMKMGCICEQMWLGSNYCIDLYKKLKHMFPQMSHDIEVETCIDGLL